MLHQLDDSLRDVLRDRLRLDRSELDIVFETPDAEWGAGISKPTVNLFLWDIRRSVDESRAGRERVVVDGEERWRQLLPRMEFQYLLTAWTSEVVDEHKLLGRCLVAILGNPVLQGDHVPAFASAMAQSPTIRVARSDGKDLADFWGAIDGKLKPGLNLVVSASVDPEVSIAAGPPTEAHEVTVAGLDGSPTSTRRRYAGRSDAVGAVVRSPCGTATVDTDGRFLIDAEPGQEIVVETDPPQVVIAGAGMGGPS